MRPGDAKPGSCQRQHRVQVDRRQQPERHVPPSPADRDRRDDRHRHEDRELVPLVDPRRQREEREREHREADEDRSYGRRGRTAATATIDGDGSQQDRPDRDRGHGRPGPAGNSNVQRNVAAQFVAERLRPDQRPDVEGVRRQDRVAVRQASSSIARQPGHAADHREPARRAPGRKAREIERAGSAAIERQHGHHGTRDQPLDPLAAREPAPSRASIARAARLPSRDRPRTRTRRWRRSRIGPITARPIAYCGLISTAKDGDARRRARSSPRRRSSSAPSRKSDPDRVHLAPGGRLVPGERDEEVEGRGHPPGRLPRASGEPPAVQQDRDAEVREDRRELQQLVGDLARRLTDDRRRARAR